MYYVIDKQIYSIFQKNEDNNFLIEKQKKIILLSKIICYQNKIPSIRKIYNN